MDGIEESGHRLCIVLGLLAARDRQDRPDPRQRRGVSFAILFDRSVKSHMRPGHAVVHDEQHASRLTGDGLRDSGGEEGIRA